MRYHGDRHRPRLPKSPPSPPSTEGRSKAIPAGTPDQSPRPPRRLRTGVWPAASSEGATLRVGREGHEGEGIPCADDIPKLILSSVESISLVGTPAPEESDELRGPPQGDVAA